MTPPEASLNTPSNPDRPIPRASTGSRWQDVVADAITRLVQLERRIDPWLRPAFDATLRDPVAALATALKNTQRKDEGLALAQERMLPDEDALVQSVIDSFRQQMSSLWKPGRFERGGNTKTHGIVRGELTVRDGLPAHLRRGIFAEPKTYAAWVRFSGPGPYITPDIDDVGFMSISVKLMGVPGPKLMDEEKFTQDLLAVCTPTFVTGDIRSNADLQKQSLKNASMYHFLNLREPHVLDLLLQSLWTKTQSSPLEAPYFSCVPYLMGDGQAMQYSFWPVTDRRTKIPNLPGRPPDDYLRNALVNTLQDGDAALEMRVQVQTDAFRMPLEDASVLWPENLSPRMPVALLRLPRQTMYRDGELAFARRLTYTPWHCIAEHRPLGNQSRARHRMYAALAELRHSANAVPHYEPDGTEDLRSMA